MEYEKYEHCFWDDKKETLITSNNWVRSDLKGKHRDHCLCWSCERYPCQTSKDTYANCKKHKIVTPVWECEYFKFKGDK